MSLLRTMSYSAPSVSIFTSWTSPGADARAWSNVVHWTVTWAPAAPCPQVELFRPLAVPLSAKVNVPSSPAIAVACTETREARSLASTLRCT